MAPKPPTPDKASLIRFLLTCPLFQRLTEPDVEPLAERLQMHHYEDSTDLFSRVATPDSTPLRLVAHGQASWEPSNSSEQKGAWMLTTGSCFGLSAINDWACAKKIPSAWPAPDPAPVRCNAVGPLWVLELAPQHFDDVFMHPQGNAICSRLLCMFPTGLNAPRVVAALRSTPQFSRVTTPKLYRLLERAPTLAYGPMQLEQPPEEPEEPEEPEDDDPQQLGLEGKSVTSPALYYVLEGQLTVSNDEQTVSLGVGELGGPGMFDDSPQANQFAAQATDEARAVVLTQASLLDQIRTDPGLARALGPRGLSKAVDP
ncbi:hypothetical protein [Enhygromyxa salina]|uniref:hypothetical protein n=1 Tax=Enhygromyxa salina TaxID=215803 RepID=UPI000D03CA1E|nr:hypothetical protein [Enhygromyxa salina]